MLSVDQFSDFGAQRIPLLPLSHQLMPNQHQLQQIHDVLWPLEKRDDWYGASEESFENRRQHNIDIGDIQVELNVQNYKKKFNNLICWEEKSNIEILGRR